MSIFKYFRVVSLQSTQLASKTWSRIKRFKNIDSQSSLLPYMRLNPSTSINKEMLHFIPNQWSVRLRVTVAVTLNLLSGPKNRAGAMAAFSVPILVSLNIRRSKCRGIPGTLSNDHRQRQPFECPVQASLTSRESS